MKKARIIGLLNRVELSELASDIANFPRQFRTDYTSTFLEEMEYYVRGGRVWRINIMGETRLGKSESAQTIAFIYKQMFNKAVNKKLFFDKSLNKKLKSASIKLQKIGFTVKNIHGNQADYLYDMRERSKSGELIFGQINLIDEARELEGGLGSMTEYAELKNINNIIAKFCPSELWLSPKKWISQNAPYGLIAYKKDEVRRENWLKCYKMTSTPYGDIPTFVGWVCLPLHPYEKHRDNYEDKKNEWILAEIHGNTNPRLRLRFTVASLLAKNKLFKRLDEKGRFVSNIRMQKSILDKMIIKGEVQDFNEEEKRDIISLARSEVLEGEEYVEEKKKQKPKPKPKQKSTKKAK